MCTAIDFTANDHYFGRNLDLEYCLREAVAVTPRNFPFHFRMTDSLTSHYAMIGTATISQNFPLYYEATNEMGLSMAGLHFAGNAFYREVVNHHTNISPFELIPFILGQCADVNDAVKRLKKINLAAIPFSQDFPLSDLHWIINDRTKSVTVEPLKEGLIITENPVGVLTNNPPFDYHINNLASYLHLTNRDPINLLSPHISLVPYSRGMGAMGLPGDLSSASRFVRAVFTKMHSVIADTEAGAVNQFFHILSAVSMTEGTVTVGDKLEKTVYSCCCNTDKCIYYYTTYENPQITAVHLYHENLSSQNLVSYPLTKVTQILTEN